MRVLGHPCLVLALAASLLGVARGADEPRVIPLWPEGVPGLRSDASEEVVLEGGRFTNIHHPSISVYPADSAKSVRTGVVFSAGGGYVRVSIGEGGGAETRWLNSLGVTVFVLKYRHKEYGQPAPLQDVLRAIRIVRSRAEEFGVAPDRIGVAGGSAGAHVSASAATLWDAPEGVTNTALDAISARPDFAILVYPVVTMAEPHAHGGSRRALLGENPSPAVVERWSIERQVRRDMPPVFLVATMADKSVPVENTLHLYQALRDAGVPTEMHVYAAGSHGNSRDPQYGPTALWPERAEEWMRFNGWLTRAR